MYILSDEKAIMAESLSILDFDKVAFFYSGGNYFYFAEPVTLEFVTIDKTGQDVNTTAEDTLEPGEVLTDDDDQTGTCLQNTGMRSALKCIILSCLYSCCCSAI